MSLKRFFIGILFFFTVSLAFGQEASKPLYELIIYKSVNDRGGSMSRIVNIDSLGNVLSNREKVGTFDMKVFNEEINQFLNHEKVIKYPGSDKLMIVEAAMPGADQQLIFVTIKFSDDLAKEQQLLTKTYYGWTEKHNKTEKEYLFYNYFSESERILLKSLLE